jgi:hypothetical protein
MIVDETEITQQSSPLIDGNPTANTPNLATFKLLLTGADDSALVATSNKSEPEELSRRHNCVFSISFLKTMVTGSRS